MRALVKHRIFRLLAGCRVVCDLCRRQRWQAKSYCRSWGPLPCWRA